MATVTSAGSGNWNTGATWDGDHHVPIADDVVIIATGHIVVVDVVRIPATAGSLASLTAQTTGKITVAVASYDTGSINVTGNITAGSGNPFIALNDASSSAVHYTINAGGIIGGSANNASCITSATRAHITLNFTSFTGGTGTATAAFGYFNNVGSFNLTLNGGTISGGSSSASSSCGLYLFTNNPALLIISAGTKLINTTSMAIGGTGVPTSWSPDAGDYWTWSFGNFAKELLDHQILNTVVNGSITGNRVDCPVAKALDSSGNYGDPAAPLVGTYHEATVAEVQDGVMFGAGSALEGTYAGGGGGGRPEIRGNNL